MNQQQVGVQQVTTTVEYLNKSDKNYDYNTNKMCCCNNSSKASKTSAGGNQCLQWPDRCCFCFSKRGGTVLTGLASILGNFFVILPCVYAIIKPEFWNEGFVMFQNWIEYNHWDEDVTLTALAALRKINTHKQIYLIILISYCSLHVLNSILLILGSFLQKRLLLLPWLIQDMFTISLMTLVFIAWAFLSFFVHILVAIFFPVVSGALLGLWIYMWRNSRDLFQIYGAEVSEHGGTIYRKLPAGTRQLTSV